MVYTYFQSGLLLVTLLIPLSALAGHGGSSSPELEVVGQFPLDVEGLTMAVWAYVASFGSTLIIQTFIGGTF